MAFPPFLSSAFVFLIFFASSVVESKTVGFTVDLIHRDSPSSPYYNPSSTPAQRLTSSFLRSHKRATYFKSAAASPPFSAILPDGGAYLMNYTLGTPPVPTLSVADTGSDLIWTQCVPCYGCYDQTAPLFDPTKSKTYNVVPCNSEKCNSVPEPSCSKRSSCTYKAQYGDSSYSLGAIASETLVLGSASFEGITIGCGFNNSGTFSENTSGIVGLGGGPASLISQLGSSINGKFSYCLSPEGTKGELNFGDDAVVSGHSVVSTGIQTLEQNTFYFLKLYGFTVGGKRAGKAAASSPEEGIYENIIIDSGTTLTYLSPELFNQLVEGVKDAVKAETVADPEQIFELCYQNKKGLELPEVIAHFEGADVELKDYNVFVEVSEEVVCLAFSTSPEVSIYGNIAQRNFLVGYDLVKKTVSFKANGCGTTD